MLNYHSGDFRREVVQSSHRGVVAIVLSDCANGWLICSEIDRVVGEKELVAKLQFKSASKSIRDSQALETSRKEEGRE